MEWFQGEVAMGIQTAQALRVTFVAFLADSSADSQAMQQAWQSDEVKTAMAQFPAIGMLITEEKQKQQLLAIFAGAPCPGSSFFSTVSGSMMSTVAPNADNSSQSLAQQLANALQAATQSPATSTSTPVTASTEQRASAAAPSKEAPSGINTPSTPPKASAQSDAVKARLATLREKRDKMAADEARRKELARREQGKVGQEVQAAYEEQQVKRRAEEVKREKAAQQARLKAVRKKVQEDKAKRKAANASVDTEEQPKLAQPDTTAQGLRQRVGAPATTGWKVSLDLPSGQRETMPAKPTTTIAEVLTTCQAQYGVTEPFYLVLPRPFTAFTSAQGSATLESLEFPSRSRLLVKQGTPDQPSPSISSTANSASGSAAADGSTPQPNVCESIVAYIKSFFASAPISQSPSAPTSQPHRGTRRVGRVFDDRDDQKRTTAYNGNSTQFQQ
eukprot:m.359724 g.359724  ORF g.359724 m.359724 type:complete len:446 (+) comp18694_c0_seq1:84-1421(+)